MTALIQQWTDGDEQAARLIFDRYSQRLVAVAEKHLSHRLAGRVDGEDVVQSVFRTFFSRTNDGKFQIDSSGELWNLLVQITLNKTRMQARRHTAQQRDVRAEAAGDEAWLQEKFHQQPGPEEAAEFLDQVSNLLSGLPEAYSEILTYRLEGHSRAEIARKLGISRQSVSRALRMMQDRMQRSLDARPLPRRPESSSEIENSSGQSRFPASHGTVPALHRRGHSDITRSTATAERRPTREIRHMNGTPGTIDALPLEDRNRLEALLPEFVIGHSTGDVNFPQDPAIPPARCQITCRREEGSRRSSLADLDSDSGAFVRIARLRIEASDKAATNWQTWR